MPSNDESKILPPMLNGQQRGQANRTMLGVLLLVLFIAVVLALWFLLFDSDDDSSSANQDVLPTAVPIPTSTAVPANSGSQDDAATAPTSAPVATPTPVPEGFEACGSDRSPLTTATYIVDTVDTPLNQRVEPAVGSEQAGTFEPGTTGLSFNGECLVNLADGYVWWQIDNGTQDVWIASDFVTPN